MGFASGSVFPLPTASSHAREEHLIRPAFQKAAFSQVDDVLRTCSNTAFKHTFNTFCAINMQSVTTKYEKNAEWQVSVF